MLNLFALKIKVKSLTAEARIIRSQELKLKGKNWGHLASPLQGHRRGARGLASAVGRQPRSAQDPGHRRRLRAGRARPLPGNVARPKALRDRFLCFADALRGPGNS